MMKRFFTAALMALVAIISFAQSSKEKADALYENEEYQAAITAYENILANEGVAPEVYYNLGNSYYKIDDIPHAILNYERALKLDPGDNDIRANLALARGKTIDKVTPPSEMFFVTWWRNLTNVMSVDAWSVWGIVSFVLMLAGVLVYMFVPALIFRKIGVYGAIALLVVCLIANLAALTQRISNNEESAAIVIESAVVVKSSPSETSTDLFLIHEGTKVEILDSSMKQWMEVKFEEGKQGWVPVGAVEVI